MTAYIDTSVLAKCYIREPHSLKVLDWVESSKGAMTAALVLVEFRRMLVRRHQTRQIDTALTRRALAQLDSHMRDDAWHIHQGDCGEFAETRDLIDVLPDLPLQALDVLHLAAARRVGALEFSTSDSTSTQAEAALDLTVFDFS